MNYKFDHKLSRATDAKIPRPPIRHHHHRFAHETFCLIATAFSLHAAIIESTPIDACSHTVIYSDIGLRSIGSQR